jgi:hypothetical protein
VTLTINMSCCDFCVVVGSEIARQNKITQQILAQYLQKKLFPHLTPSVPSTPAPQVAGNGAEQDSSEALDSDESEQIPSHVTYDDDDEGQKKHALTKIVVL